MSDEAVKTYELRDLEAQDIFSLGRLIKKIGIANFKKCLEGEEIKKAIASYIKGAKKTESETESSTENTEKEDEKETENDTALEGLTIAGIDVTFEIASVVFDRLPECETEVYNFLSSLSGLKVNAIQKLPMCDFFDMVIDVIKKPEFKDFFKRASRLLS